MSVVFCSCKSYNNSYRANSVTNKTIQTSRMVVDVMPDFTKSVNGTSRTFRGRDSEKLARENAYYNAIVSNNIDVLVDPVYEIRIKNTLFGLRTSADVRGFAGKYQNPRRLENEQFRQYNDKLDALTKLTNVDAVVKENRKTVILSGAGGNEIEVANTAPSLIENFNTLFYKTNIVTIKELSTQPLSSVNQEFASAETSDTTKKSTTKKGKNKLLWNILFPITIFFN